MVFGVLVQVIMFAVVSSLGMLMVRPALKHRLHRNAEPAVMGVAAIEGSSATVVEAIGEGRGMVKIGGELWQARPFDGSQAIEAGAEVRVVEVSGATALVWRRAERSPDRKELAVEPGQVFLLALALGSCSWSW